MSKPRSTFKKEELEQWHASIYADELGVRHAINPRTGKSIKESQHPDAPFSVLERAYEKYSKQQAAQNQRMAEANKDEETTDVRLLALKEAMKHLMVHDPVGPRMAAKLSSVNHEFRRELAPLLSAADKDKYKHIKVITARRCKDYLDAHVVAPFHEIYRNTRVTFNDEVIKYIAATANKILDEFVQTQIPPLHRLTAEELAAEIEHRPKRGVAPYMRVVKRIPHMTRVFPSYMDVLGTNSWLYVRTDLQLVLLREVEHSLRTGERPEFKERIAQKYDIPHRTIRSKDDTTPDVATVLSFFAEANVRRMARQVIHNAAHVRGPLHGNVELTLADIYIPGATGSADTARLQQKMRDAIKGYRMSE